ncbi:hypothetical protein DPEC_G00374030 [Dallia pectoralis]|nr:hypothetical protein DPEC_G00374030 [Dallia pectoralis]
MDMSIPPDLVLLLHRNMLQDIERGLGQNPDSTEKLVTYLASRGGKNLKDSVKRIFQSLFTNHLSIQMNWTGSGQKVSFNNLHLKRVIHRAAEPCNQGGNRRGSPKRSEQIPEGGIRPRGR